MEHNDNAAAAPLAPPPEWTPPTMLDAVPFRVNLDPTADAAIPPTYGVATGQEESAAAPAPAVHTQCVALTHQGEQCCRLSADGSEYCGQHHRIMSDPARKEQWLRRQREIMKNWERLVERRRQYDQRMLEMSAGYQQMDDTSRATAARQVREQYDSPEQRRLGRQQRQQQKEFDEEVARAEVRAEQKKWEKLPWYVRLCTTSPERARQREEARKAKERRQKRQRRGRRSEWGDLRFRNQMAGHATMAGMTAGVH